jgi:cellobiose-specific phosphotransferase system component IIC
MIRVAPLRPILGFLIAPAAGAAVIPTWWALHIWPLYGSELAVTGFVAYFKWALFFGYSGAIFIGLPLYAVLRKVRWGNAIVFLFASYLIGIAWPAVVFVKNGPPLPHATPILDYFIWWGGSGAVGGLIFWLIDRPDLRVSGTRRHSN